MNLRTRLAVSAGLFLLVGSCSGGDGTASGGVHVVATTTVLGDVAGAVGGAAATVEVLMPVGVDPHDFRPSSRQVARMEEAQLIVANGLGLEEGLDDVLGAMQRDGHRVLRVGEQLDRLRTLGGGSPDPHIWMDPSRMTTAARLIAVELESISPGAGWTDRAEAYAATLDDLDAEIRAILDVIPEERRVLVTNHDSLGYFAERYDLAVLGVVVPGGSTLAQPSSADLADLVDAIERLGIRTIFAETTEPVTLAESVAAEVGGDVAVVELLIGSLGGPGADNYVDMLRTDARRIAEALG